MLLGLAWLSLAGAAGAGGAEWAVSAGSFDIERSFVGPVIGGLEVRLDEVALWRPPWGVLLPAFGLAATENNTFYAYGGVDLHIPLSKRWRVTPQLGAGLYDDGDGEDLGGPLEFRSGVELAYGISRRGRVGLSFYHLSNAGIYDRNPGANSLAVTVVLSGFRR